MVVEFAAALCKRLELDKGKLKAYRIKARTRRLSYVYLVNVVVRQPFTILIAGFIAASYSPASCYATAEWEYKLGQIVNINHGLSPDRRFAVAATEDQSGKFSLLLIDGASRNKIQPLGGVAGPLDTAPEAFHAEWAPDSRHVAIWYRVDRHLEDFLMYRIENRRAYAVSGPESFIELIAPSTRNDSVEIQACAYSLKWRDANHFMMAEFGDIHFAEGDKTMVKALGKYGQPESDAPNYAKYSVEAVCELARDDRFRVLSLTPGAFK